MEKRGFEKNRSKAASQCPCGKSNKDGKFAPFKGMSEYGQCHSCGVTYFPPDENEAPITNAKQKYISPDQLEHSLVFIENDTFFKHVLSITGDKEKTLQHFKSMNVGVKDGNTVFWMIDEYGRICLPKSFKYGEDGKKIRIVAEQSFNQSNGYYPCLFNASQINEDKPIVLVEAEKSAVIASYFAPQYTWIAAGGANGVSADKAHALKGKDVIILFDADQAGREGSEKVEETLTKQKCRVYNYDMFPDRIDGFDVADMFSERSDQVLINGFIEKLDEVYHELNYAEAKGLEAGIVDIDEDLYADNYINDRKDRGETSHFYELDAVFKWKKGLVYTYTGYAGTGKSEMNLFLCFLKAWKDGWRFIMFVPESMSSNEEGVLTVEEVVDTLVNIYWGKTVDVNDMSAPSEDEYREAIRFIKKHFTFIYPEDGFCTQAQIIKQAGYVLDTRGKHDGIIIDPWNNVASAQNKMELLDDYLRRMIADAKRFAILKRLAWIYVTHPSKPPIGKDGSVPPLDMHQIRGGMSFPNGSDFVIIIERPYYFMGEVEYEGRMIPGRIHPEVHFNVRKIKNQKLLGCTPNFVPMYFDRIKNRYENETRISPMDPAYKKELFKPSEPWKMPEDKSRDVTNSDFTITLPAHEEPRGQVDMFEQKHISLDDDLPEPDDGDEMPF